MRHNELKWVSHINTKYTKRFAAYLYSESLLEIMFSVLVLVLVVVVRNIAAYILRSILSVRVGQVAVTTSWGRSGQLTLALIHSASIQSLKIHAELTSWTPTYQLAEGDWYWCTASQSTSGSTQPGERPATARSDDVSSSGNTPSCCTQPKKKRKQTLVLFHQLSKTVFETPRRRRHQVDIYTMFRKRKTQYSWL